MEKRDGTLFPGVAPLGGLLDDISDSLDAERRAYGFLTNASPLGKMVDTTCRYSNGYPNFTFADFCDGYIVITPLCELNICKFIPNFVDSTNIDHVRPQVNAWLGIPKVTIEQANDTLRVWHDQMIEMFENNKALMKCD